MVHKLGYRDIDKRAVAEKRPGAWEYCLWVDHRQNSGDQHPPAEPDLKKLLNVVDTGVRPFKPRQRCVFSRHTSRSAQERTKMVQFWWWMVWCNLGC